MIRWYDKLLYNVPDYSKKITIKDINVALYKLTGISHDILLQKCKQRDLADARHIYSKALREYIYPDSLAAIGKLTNRNHSTVLHSIKCINTEPFLIKMYSNFKYMLYNT